MSQHFTVRPVGTTENFGRLTTEAAARDLAFLLQTLSGKEQEVVLVEETVLPG